MHYKLILGKLALASSGMFAAAPAETPDTPFKLATISACASRTCSPGANWLEGQSTDSGALSGTDMERREFLKPGYALSIEIEGVSKIETPLQAQASQVK